MSKKANLTDIRSGYTSSAVLNENFTKLNEQFQNTLSLDGSTPNALNADLDMNNNSILNLEYIEAGGLKIDGVRVVDIAAVPLWRSEWQPTTKYGKDNIIRSSGNAYISLVSHTSTNSFSQDLMDNKWELFAAKGSSGSGTGDMLAVNNLIELPDTQQARANLGLGTAATTDSTAYATEAQGTTADAAIPKPSGASAGDLLYYNGSSWVRLPKGGAGKYLAMNSANNKPEWSEPPVGVNQTWQDMTGQRASNTVYQNTTGRAISYVVHRQQQSGGSSMQVGETPESMVPAGKSDSYTSGGTPIVPNGHYYRFNSNFTYWSELR